MLDAIGSLWGESSITWLLIDRPKEARAVLDMIAFTVYFSRLDQCIDFGHAELVPGNTPGKATHFDAIHDDQIENPDLRSNAVRGWLMQLGIDNGFHNVAHEIDRWK
jgi:hypothetical protein